MSYKLALQIKQEFERDAVLREEFESKEKTRKDNLTAQEKWNNRNTPEETRYEDDPSKINLHRKHPHHRGALSEELHDAAWREDLALMVELIQGDPSLLDECDTGGQNLLHLAAFWGTIFFFIYLLPTTTV